MKIVIIFLNKYLFYLNLKRRFVWNFNFQSKKIYIFEKTKNSVDNLILKFKKKIKKRKIKNEIKKNEYIIRKRGSYNYISNNQLLNSSRSV